MKKLLFICLILSSCASVKRYSYEATNLNESGEIHKNHIKCEVVGIKLTQKGFKHILVTANNDTLIRFYQSPLEVNKCYWIWQTRGEKNL